MFVTGIIFSWLTVYCAINNLSRNHLRRFSFTHCQYYKIIGKAYLIVSHSNNTHFYTSCSLTKTMNECYLFFPSIYREWLEVVAQGLVKRTKCVTKMALHMCAKT
jgi:hypothetical protein